MKKLFLLVSALVLSITVFGQAASWIGNSFIVANGNWYNAHGTGNPSSFDKADLGVIDSLVIGGQIQSYGDMDGASNPAILNYKIDDGEIKTIQLDWFDYKDNNNWFGANSSEDVMKVDTFDLLENGEHTIAIWFCKASTHENASGGFIYDSNGGNNYVATFTKGVAPVISYKDSVYYLAGNFTNWAEGMHLLPDTIAFPQDSLIEFKQVLVRTVLFDGDSVGKDTTWYGQTTEGEYMTRENMGEGWKLDGEHNVLLATDAAGEYVFALNDEGEFVVTWPYKCTGEFGILVNETYIPAALNEERQDVVEYMLIDVELKVNDLVQIYDKCNETSWIITEYMIDSYQFHVTQDNKYIIQDGEADLYDFYFQIGPDKIYVGRHSDPMAVENVETMSAPIKFIENGQLYIMRGAHTFDAQGKMIR